MKCILVYSGGLDSTVLLYHLLDQGYEVKAMSFNYGQKQLQEVSCAQAICKTLGVEHRLVDLSSLQPIFTTSSLTNKELEVVNGPYEIKAMQSTVVPNRNMIFLSIAAAWALSLHWDAIAYACHSGDHAVYPDCRPVFVDALDKALHVADWSDVKLLAPFVHYLKKDIVKRGFELQVPFEHTWSCYKGRSIQCGQCPTCIERQGSFRELGAKDPTLYEAAYTLNLLQQTP